MRIFNEGYRSYLAIGVTLCVCVRMYVINFSKLKFKDDPKNEDDLKNEVDL